MARTQAQRKHETRVRLLAAAASLFAERGFEAVSVDAVADLADRTAGSVYAHFGNKEGLLLALVEAWKDEVATATEAEFIAAGGEPNLAALWHNFVDPVPHAHGDLHADSAQNLREGTGAAAGTEGGTDRGLWVLLEHELWLKAARNPDLTPAVADRYRDARALLATALSRWTGTPDPDAMAIVVLGLLLGLEMQRRIDPGEVPDHLAIDALAAVLSLAPPADPRTSPHHPAQPSSKERPR